MVQQEWLYVHHTMYDLMVKPAESAGRIGAAGQQLNNILSFRKSTNLNSLALCFEALGKPLTVTHQHFACFDKLCVPCNT